MSSIDSRRSARQQARDEAIARERTKNRVLAKQAAREAQERRAAKREEARREAAEFARQLDEATAAHRRVQEQLRKTQAIARALEQRKVRRLERQARQQKADKTAAQPALPDKPSSRLAALIRDDRRDASGTRPDVVPRSAREAKPEKQTGAGPSRPVRKAEKLADRPPIGSPDDRAKRKDTRRPRVETALPSRSEAQKPGGRSTRTEPLMHRRDAEHRERPRLDRPTALKRADTKRPTLERKRSLSDSASVGSDAARPAATRSEPSLGSPRAVLESRLSSGVLSGSLPWLITRGARLTTIDGDTVVLRGLNAPSFESDLPDWPFNLVRVAQDLEHLTCDTLDHADAAIARNAARGAYTAFALQLAASAIADPSEDPLTRLASRYVDEPAVLFVLSPPADVSDERNLRLLQNALARLRSVHPRALAIVEAAVLPDDGAAWPVRGFGGSTDDAIPNLVYGAPPVTACEPRLRAIARRLPLCLAGWPQAGASLRAEALLSILAADGIGWTAALPPSGRWTEATRYTRFVQRALTIAAIWGAALPRAT